MQTLARERDLQRRTAETAKIQAEGRYYPIIALGTIAVDALGELFNDSSHGKTRERVLLRGTEAVLDWLDKAHDAAAAPVRRREAAAPRELDGSPST